MLNRLKMTSKDNRELQTGQNIATSNNSYDRFTVR